MASQMELEIQRRNTKAFIDDNPVEIVLNRPITVLTDSGGRKQDDVTTLPPQVMRLVPESIRNVSFGGLGSQAGPQTSVSVALLAEWNADIKRGDYFNIGNARYEVVYMYDEFEKPRQYEIRAGLMERV